MSNNTLIGGSTHVKPPTPCFIQVSIECSLGALSLAKGERYGVAFPNGYNTSNNTLFFTGLQVRFLLACGISVVHAEKAASQLDNQHRAING